MPDRNDSKGKDNTDRPLKPTEQGRSNHLPKGSISPQNQMNFGPGKASLQPSTSKMQEKIHPEKQRGKRNFSREQQLGAEMRGEKDKQNALSKEFKGATDQRPKDRGHER